jgi:endonuclease/exonuclease/phosphatase family metal-dependent hydrolase
MRFLLYNIRYGTGTGHHFHVPFPFIGYLRPTHHNEGKIAEFIRSYNPDIVGLVEVDSGSFRTRGNQVAMLAEALGHFHVYQSKYRPQSIFRAIPVFSKQCNAFLTRERITANNFHYFNAGIKRLVIELEFDDFVIFLVHLSLKFRHRHEQLRTLYELVQSIHKPVIVAGDFNPVWGDDELHLFMAATGLLNANTDALPSFPSSAPRRQLDFILHSPEIVITHFEVPQVQHSDHCPLVCDFHLWTPEDGDRTPRPGDLGDSA